MFWTEVIRQRMLFEQFDEYVATERIANLIAFSEENFPENDQNFHRQFAFLTHRATQQFLAPLLRDHFGNLDSAKVPTLEWLDTLGSFETFARSTRSGNGESKPAAIKIRSTPEWYAKYCATARYRGMVSEAEHSWTTVLLRLNCAVNSRHEYQVMHHCDYGRLGEGDEFRCMIPLCNDCHASISARGPRLPAEMPEGVKQWL